MGRFTSADKPFADQHIRQLCKYDVDRLHLRRRAALCVTIHRQRTGLLSESAGPFLSSGMCLGVDALQGWDCHLSIDLRCLDISVTENLLNDSDVGSVLVHQRRHSVPEKVTSPGLP